MNKFTIEVSCQTESLEMASVSSPILAFAKSLEHVELMAKKLYAHLDNVHVEIKEGWLDNTCKPDVIIMAPCKGKTYVTLHGLRTIVERKFGPLNDDHITKEQKLIDLYQKADQIVSKKEFGLCRDIITCRYYIEE